MHNQSKKASLAEACVNTAVGLLLAFIVNAMLMASVGVTATMSQNLAITLGHTVVSIIRGYAVRRTFNSGFWTAIWMKGATAYEWQLGPVYGRIVSLSGDHWRWKPWLRFSIHLDRDWIKERKLRWKYRNEPDDICCCGCVMGKGGDICYHGGCKSMKEYVIQSEMEK